MSVSKLKEKLNHVINYSEWTFDDLLMEHDYYRPEITDCIVYYTTGYLSNYILKFIKCDISTHLLILWRVALFRQLC